MKVKTVYLVILMLFSPIEQSASTSYLSVQGIVCDAPMEIH